ncbi:MAG: methionyl-tRNA formyltransferase [Puniceicoccales bacterium]|jgi:methionyl-tRNA formyltransferase|nr:methionyl-tRNA formyltransferase [Puniceicoccales bacterium]
MKKRVVFFGSDGISLPLLEFLLASDCVEMTAIISQPDKPSGRGQKLVATAVSKFARHSGIPLLTPVKPDEETANWIRFAGCDIILVMAYGHILRKNILQIPSLGIFNFHASLLPKYRGASPIETAIACGETETGVSLMEIVEEMDAGGVADAKEVPIGMGDTRLEVAANIAVACPILLQRNLDKICAGTLKLENQNSAEATFTKKISKIDGMLDFAESAAVLHNRIRALSPHIGCHIEHRGILLKIGRASVEFTDCSPFNRGEIMCADGNCVKIATADGALLIHELQKPGRKMLPVGDFLNGCSVNIGEIIPSHSLQSLVFKRPQRQIKNSCEEITKII